MRCTMLPNFGWVRQRRRAPICEQVMTKKSLLETVSLSKYLRWNPVRDYPSFPHLAIESPIFSCSCGMLSIIWNSLPPSPSQVSLPFIVLLALESLDKPLQFNRIAIHILNFYTHPPLPEVRLTAELLRTLRNLRFSVPNSLTLPKYLAQFECKLDNYLLKFTVRSSCVASLLVS